MRKGFTLIELMIVIAIIAIIAAIAIPNLLSGRMSANEVSAMGTLKQFTSTEAIWLQQGPDGNGMKDYWTYDVSCLHRLYRADGSTKVAFVPLDVARADACPAAFDGTAFGATELPYEIWTNQGPNGSVEVQPKSGFWFHAMLRTNLVTPPTGDFAADWYNKNLVGSGATYATNHNAYAFMATPDAYGASGIRSFIVNEAGTIYATDTGANNERGTGYGAGGMPIKGDAGDGQTNTGPAGNATNKKWETSDASDVLCWPTRNPAQIPTASGKYWEVAE
jgi:prepilin-type N-terminal cleavage/methylation domain-containing protein